MTPEELAALIRNILIEAIQAGELELAESDLPQTPSVERPRSREHGDWATNIAMQLAKAAGKAPREVAAIVSARLTAQPGIASVDVAGPGFINIRIDVSTAGELPAQILAAGNSFGENRELSGSKVNLEYVSANPTGPIHLGGARWAAVGDSLARLLVASGAQVTREYYFNDHGSQIDKFARSLLAKARRQAAPEDGYGGQYIEDIAKTVCQVVAEEGHPDPTTLPDAEATEVFRARGVELMFAQIKEKLHEFRTEFDVYFHEQSLYDDGEVRAAIDELGERGATYQKDGALWLKSTDFGDDKDRVLIKSNGEAAYLAGDVAYYVNKRRRGADTAIYLLGADHHGYIGRMMAVCAAFGDQPQVNMQIIIGQMVNLLKDGEPVRMSKRAGTVVTLDDLVEAVGVDAARYSLARVSMDQNLDIDLDLLTRHSNENPVYYVQYAHARTCSVARNAAEHGVALGESYAPEALDHEADQNLLGVLAQFPATVEQAAKLREPHRVARYLESLASAYHTWYQQCRVTPRAQEPVTAGHVARLWLNQAVAQVLRNGLRLLGVSAPEKM